MQKNTMQSEAYIYLADQRAQQVSDLHRSYHVFHESEYAHKQSLGNIKMVSEEFLKEDSEKIFEMPEHGMLTLMPCVGALYFNINGGSYTLIDVNQFAVIHANQGDKIEVHNPYKSAVINYITINLADADATASQNVVDFDLDQNKNKLLTLFQKNNIKIHFGLFDGRVDQELALASLHAYVFIVGGAFEVQNRLLHEKDSLAIFNHERLEFEALSNHAMILVIEGFQDSVPT